MSTPTPWPRSFLIDTDASLGQGFAEQLADGLGSHIGDFGSRTPDEAARAGAQFARGWLEAMRAEHPDLTFSYLRITYFAERGQQGAKLGHVDVV